MAIITSLGPWTATPLTTGLRFWSVVGVVQSIGAIGRRRRFRLAAEELILKLALLAAKLGDLLFQLGDSLLGHSVLTAPVAGLLPEFEVLASQLRHFRSQLDDLFTQFGQPSRLGGCPINVSGSLQHEVFHDPGDLPKMNAEREDHSGTVQPGKTGWAKFYDGGKWGGCS